MGDFVGVSGGLVFFRPWGVFFGPAGLGISISGGGEQPQQGGEGYGVVGRLQN